MSNIIVKKGTRLTVGKIYRDSQATYDCYMPIDRRHICKYREMHSDLCSCYYVFNASIVTYVSRLKKNLVLVEDTQLKPCWHTNYPYSNLAELTIGNPLKDIEGYAYNTIELLDICLNSPSWETTYISTVGSMARNKDGSIYLDIYANDKFGEDPYTEIL